MQITKTRFTAGLPAAPCTGLVPVLWLALKGWVLEGNYRYYTRSAADFYSDLFPRQDSQNFMGRDKELSTFYNNSLGFRLSYDLLRAGGDYIDKGSINPAYDHIWFNYDDFRDLRPAGYTAGSEPLYQFSADEVQIYLSVWF
jgi:hypothetical protein